MKIALLHNPRAGNSMLNAKKLVRQFESARYEVLYASIKEKDWEKTLLEPVDRVVIAGATVPSADLLHGSPAGNCHFVGPRAAWLGA
jgi:hypothetical protein